MQVVKKANLPAQSDSLVFIQDIQSPDVSDCILQSQKHAYRSNWLLKFKGFVYRVGSRMKNTSGTTSRRASMKSWSSRDS